MSVDYNAILYGYIPVMDLAHTLIDEYDAEDVSVRVQKDNMYQIIFSEPSVLTWMERRANKFKPKVRMLSVFANGNAAGDYASITTLQMTMVSLGCWGDVEAIITCLLKKYGGWYKNESVSHDWVKYEGDSVLRPG